MKTMNETELHLKQDSSIIFTNFWLKPSPLLYFKRIQMQIKIILHLLQIQILSPMHTP